ncbi:MAG: hypothetical protein U9N40_04330 [Euryarchaeota archaeon]|nr:hypothetical protein [Euryarchaeota archaeon]
MKFSRRHELQISDIEIAKKSVKIGIFGSFQRIELLKKCREHLISKGYIHTKLSLDLEEKFPKKMHETDDEYNLRISEQLIETSDIHIIYLCEPKDSDKVPVNESAIQEYIIISNLKKTNKILVLIQEESIFAALTRGLIARNQKSIKHMDFINLKNTFKIVSHHCFECVTVNKNSS